MVEEIGPKLSQKVDLQVELPRAMVAPHLARWVVRSWCTDRIEADLLTDAELLVSELAANAILHGQGHIGLRAQLDEERLLVGVIDEGCQFERDLRSAGFQQVAGWGLCIVEDLSTRWGVHEGPTHVWFELARRGPRPGDRSHPPAG
jgi:anti-sigma regulatory factor (Ser/Thr protein kinase)